MVKHYLLLRAISVLAVIFYHAPIKTLNEAFSGGYVGVDIFFVISGYLITSIIYKELISTGNFSFIAKNISLAFHSLVGLCKSTPESTRNSSKIIFSSSVN